MCCRDTAGWWGGELDRGHGKEEIKVGCFQIKNSFDSFNILFAGAEKESGEELIVINIFVFVHFYSHLGSVFKNLGKTMVHLYLSKSVSH